MTHLIEAVAFGIPYYFVWKLMINPLLLQAVEAFP